MMSHRGIRFGSRADRGSGGAHGGFRRSGSGGFRSRGGSFRDSSRGSFRGRGEFGSRRYEDVGSPQSVMVMVFGTYVWQREGELVVKADIQNLPFVNAPIYMKDKQCIGKINVIFGPVRGYLVSIKLRDEYDIRSFTIGEKVYIEPTKIFPLPQFVSDTNGTASRARARGGRPGRSFRSARTGRSIRGSSEIGQRGGSRYSGGSGGHFGGGGGGFW